MFLVLMTVNNSHCEYQSEGEEGEKEERNRKLKRVKQKGIGMMKEENDITGSGEQKSFFWYFYNAHAIRQEMLEYEIYYYRTEATLQGKVVLIM